ncbi:GNAT family N-acetyltransferase [Saliphagus infecundisoli]|uniref:GNAT family N-acetyltransferase n=1 Tax=Saliphagus infecundisoli TaxID=1849069 RepID=A0ABD5QA43_9EURY
MPGAVYLRGQSVTLRTIEEEDIDFLHEMINNPDLWQGFGAPGPRSKREVENRFEEQNSGVALLICCDEAALGRVRLVDVDKNWGNAELTCYVAPESQRQGLATEACQLVIDYGFDHLPINKIIARIIDSNQSSRSLADKLGFVHEGTLRNHVFHEGQYLDLHCYGILEEDWRLNE